MKHRDFPEAWQPVPVKINWNCVPKRVPFFQRALKRNKKGDSKTSPLEELAKLRLATFASETWLGFSNTSASLSRHLTVGKFRVFKFSGFLQFRQFPAIPEVAARVVFPWIRLNPGSANFTERFLLF